MSSRERKAVLSPILLVQASEESDPEGRFLPFRERDAAARAARESEGADDLVRVSRRAVPLAQFLTDHFPALAFAHRTAIRPFPLAVVVGATPFLGFFVDALGAGRLLSILAFPLLGVLGWNLAIYLAAIALPALRAPALAMQRPPLPERVGFWVAERVTRSASAAEAAWIAASVRRFATAMARTSGAYAAARVRTALHLGAIGFASGIVFGMYVRGVAAEYRATWESTFITDPALVSAFLGVVLGPAAALLDAIQGGSAARALLARESMAAIRAPASGPAALWIHLWALTAALWVGVPRLVLAALAARRAHALGAALAPPLDEPYYVRLLAADRGEGVRVQVWPYSHRPSPRAADRLRELLHEHFGNRAQVTVAEPVAYGAELAALAPADAHVALFNLAQTPEQEVQGAFVEGLRARGAAHLRVLLDEEPYTARMGGDLGERVEQRRRAWERMLRAAGAPAAVLPDSLDRDALDGALRELAGAERARP